MPFLDRVRTRLQVHAEVNPPLAERLGRILAARTVEVRWGPDALQDFLLATDSDVRAAVEAFVRKCGNGGVRECGNEIMR